MKISKYTFMFDENGQEYYVYNTLSNALMEIDKESYSLLFESRNTQKLSTADFDEDLWEALCINNIISDNDTDDYFFYEKVFFFCDGACGDARNGECKQWL